MGGKGKCSIILEMVLNVSVQECELNEPLVLCRLLSREGM